MSECESEIRLAPRQNISCDSLNRISQAKTKYSRLQRERKKLFHCKQIICETQAKESKERSSSNKEHKVNALASGADEGRDKLR